MAEGAGEGTERSEIASQQGCPEGGAQRRQNTQLKKMYAEERLLWEISKDVLEGKY